MGWDNHPTLSKLSKSQAPVRSTKTDKQPSTCRFSQICSFRSPTMWPDTVYSHEKRKSNSVRTAKKTTIQPGKPGGGLAETHFVTLAYCFVIVWVIIWDPSWNLESNDSESLCFWKILVLSWAKLEAAVENEKTWKDSLPQGARQKVSKHHRSINPN